jgi:hypothetical protein
MPLLLWTLRPDIHHADRGTVSAPILRAARTAGRTPTSRAPHTAWNSHSNGPTPTSSRAVALTLPQVVTTRANRAG